MRLVALPGLGLGEQAWAPTLQHLPWPAEVQEVPGYGVPAVASYDLRPAALARAAVAALPTGDPVVLLGHSASCQVAAHVARLAPALVSGLVLVGPTTDPRSPTWSRLAARWLGTAVHEPPWQVPLLARQYGATTPRSMARAMDAARRDDLLGTLGATGAPVLVVRGRHDRICRVDWAALVASRGGAGSRAVTLPAGGHMVPLTHGRSVADVVADFLTS